MFKFNLSAKPYISNFYTYFYLKHVLILLLVLFVFSAIGQSNSMVERKQDLPMMVFEHKHIDLGEIKRGEKIPFSYVFKNKGNVDFSIDFVSGCDCTELDWPIKTFKPGDSGTIDVIFLSGKKEKDETVEIDVLLKNTHPGTNNPILEILTYTYKFKD